MGVRLNLYQRGIDRAKDSSWVHGDADYDDCHTDDDNEVLPKMTHFDDNFEYLETYDLDFLLKRQVFTLSYCAVYIPNSDF